MTVQVTVHIGGGKAGSSAIQEFLKVNAAALAGDGVLIPPEDLQPSSAITGYHVWAMEGLRRDGAETGALRLAASVENLVLKARKPVRQVLISAENLSNPARWDQLFVELARRFELEVVCYVRRQDEFLLSAWQQWYCKTSSDFWTWLIKSVGVLGNWRLTLQEWENLLPVDKIHVRVYDRTLLLNGDVRADFRNFIRSAVDLRLDRRQVNPSFNPGVLELVAGNSALFESMHDNGFFNLLRAATGDAHLAQPGESAITFEQRKAILSRYEEDNRWVAERYLNGKDNRSELFPRPRRRDYVALSAHRVERQKWNALVDLVYKLHARPK